MKLVVGINTYVTSGEADKIVENYFVEDDAYRTAYDELSDEDKTVLLYKSCMDMQKLMYRGYKKDKNQKLAFPRINRAGYESDEDMVKLAQVVNALSYIQNDESQLTSRAVEMRSAGIMDFSLGSFRIQLNRYSSSVKSNSGAVEQLLSIWLTGGVKIQ